MEDPVTQAALDHVTGLLEDAEREIAMLKRELEVAQRDLKWAHQQQAIIQQSRAVPNASPNTWGNTWNGPISGVSSQMMVQDEAKDLFDEARLRKALGIPENAKLPQDRKPKKAM